MPYCNNQIVMFFSDSSSDSDEDSQFYSVYEPKLRHRKRKPTTNTVKQPSAVCVSISIGKGRASACVQVSPKKTITTLYVMQHTKTRLFIVK